MRGNRAALGLPSRRTQEAGDGLAPTQSMSLGEFLHVLSPYFWPKAWPDRVRAAFCFAALAASKACSILAPLFLGPAVDKLSRGEFPLVELLVFGSLQFGSPAMEELQRYLYLSVRQVAYIELASRTFAQIHALGISWHLNKQSGAVLRSMERGFESASTVVNFLFLRLVPTIAELLVMVVISSLSLRSPDAAGVLLGGFAVYMIVTFALTEWRRRIRVTMVRQDNNAGRIAADSLSQSEVVKTFANEAYEVERYSAAVSAYQKSAYDTQASLSFLNISQAFIRTATVIGVLLLGARDVVRGESTVGRFVVLNAYVMQTFAPLAFLGTIYSSIVSAITDIEVLLQVLREEPDVQDAPDAPMLRLPPASAAAVNGDRYASALPVSSTGGPEELAAAKTQHDLLLRHSVAVLPDPSLLPSPSSSSSSSSRSSSRSSASAASTPSSGPASRGIGVDVEFENVTFAYPVVRGAPTAANADALLEARARVGLFSSGYRALSSLAAHASRAARPRSAEAHVQLTDVETGGGGAAGAGDGGGGGGSGGGGGGGEERRIVLRNVSFRVPANTTTAIVGATGSGKSTVARLLFRLYDVSEGCVKIAGQNVRDVQQRSVRRTVGLVPQDTSLFNDTIAFNIGYGRIGAPKADVEAASDAAQFDGFVRTLPKSYDTVVGERGLKLSGGERQRVAIARAMLKDPPVLVLDEASSALDSLTESRVQEAIDRASGGRTVIVIAHRLSTIRNADQIIVLDAGRVVEQGNFADLIAKPDGRFRAMWDMQASVAAQAAQDAEEQRKGDE